MLTNELKKGDVCFLRNGWKAVIADNKKGNIRLATVYGIFTEMGSVYAHDILYKVLPNGDYEFIEHTKDQKSLRHAVEAM